MVLLRYDRIEAQRCASYILISNGGQQDVREVFVEFERMRSPQSSRLADDAHSLAVPSESSARAFNLNPRLGRKWARGLLSTTTESPVNDGEVAATVRSCPFFFRYGIVYPDGAIVNFAVALSTATEPSGWRLA